MAFTKAQLDAYIQGLYDDDGQLSEADNQLIINFILSNGNPEIDPRDLIQIRRGDEADLPSLAQAEFAFTLDKNNLFIGGLGGNVKISSDVISVKKFGAKGDGVTDDTIAIQNAINSGQGNVFFPLGEYVVTSPIVMNSLNPVSLIGEGRWYNLGVRSKIKCNHIGDLFTFNSVLHSGINIKSLDLVKGTAFLLSGIGLNINSSGGTVSSHVKVSQCYIHGYDKAIQTQGLIYSIFEEANLSDNNEGIFFNGDNLNPNTTTSNVITLKDVRVDNNNNYGIHVKGPLRNLEGINVSFEGSGTALYVEEDSSVLNFNINGVWLELQGSHCFDIRNGINYNFSNVRLADSKPLFRKDTFNAQNVSVNNLVGSSTLSKIGVPDVKVNNIKRYSIDNAFVTETETIETVNKDNNGYDLLKQNGLFVKNYLAYWNPLNYLVLNGTVTPSLDPLGENNSLTASAYLRFYNLVQGFPFATDEKIEVSFWVKGKGEIIVNTEGDGNGIKKIYEIDSKHWVKIRFKTKVTSVMTKFTAVYFDVTPEVGSTLEFFRPCVFNDYDCLETRPQLAGLGGTEYGDSDFASYSFAERQNKNYVVNGSEAPTVGRWEVGDKVINTTPTAGGTIGWVCTTAGTPGTWKTYGSIEV